MRLRTRLAVITAKLLCILIRMLHLGNGEVVSGRAARLIEPDILTIMSGMVREKTIAVLGTNGKTTTNGILYHVLTAQGKAVACNQNGANMSDGIISAFVLAAGWNGKLNADFACIETDENAAALVFPQLRPDAVVITNLSRDQLDRYGEVDIVRDRLKKAVLSVPDAALILNCDDVLSYSLAGECKNPVFTYGISERIFEKNADAVSRESIFCRRCGAKLEYDFFHYGQLGIWRCSCCGAGRPKPDFAVSGVSIRDGVYSFSLNGTCISVRARGTYNVYNTLSAYAALQAIGAARQFAAAVSRFDYANNRENVFRVGGACVQLHLAKNPAGFQQKLSYLLCDPSPKDIVIQINDTFQDGKDISWLWDVDFKYLADAGVLSVTAGGTRRHDMGLRLKYEDIPYEITEDMQDTVRKLALEGTGNVYVIANYSGLYPLNRMLAKMQKGVHGCEAHDRTFLSGPA